MKVNQNMSKKTEVIFKFITNSKVNVVKKIIFFNNTIEINIKYNDTYKIELKNVPDIEYRLYNCRFIYSNDSYFDYCISVYFDNLNYYYCDASVLKGISYEIIFSDFYRKLINEKSCYIIYKNKPLYSQEKIKLVNNRKRINLLNCDINQIKNSNIINFNNIKNIIEEIKNNNILLNIVIKKNGEHELIGLYQNLPYNEYYLNKKEIIEFLKKKIEISKNILKYDPKISIEKNLENIDFTKYGEILLNEYAKSKDVNNNLQIKNYFSINHDYYNDDDSEILLLFSEFISLFPNYDRNLNIKKITPNIIASFYINNKIIINNFLKELDGVNEKDKIKLLFAITKYLKQYYVTNLISFNLINFKLIDTVYYDANENNRKFIENLSEDSEIFSFFLQLNSGGSKNYLFRNEPSSSKISMLNLNQIKLHLYKTIPTYGIKINNNKIRFNAMTINEVKITIINEINIFNYSIDNNSKNDINFNHRYVISNVLKHENFGHIKYSLNDSSFRQENSNLYLNVEPSSPIQFFSKFKNDIDFIFNPNEKEDIGESCCAFDYFITRGNIELYNFLKNPEANFEELFNNVKLMTDKNLDEFCKILKDIKIKTEEKEKSNELIKNIFFSNFKYDIGINKNSKNIIYVHDTSFPIIKKIAIKEKVINNINI